MDDKGHLGIIKTCDPSALTDEQIKALKKLTPEQIHQLELIAEVSKSVQLIIGIIVGIAGVLSVLNIKPIISSFLKLFQ